MNRKLSRKAALAAAAAFVSVFFVQIFPEMPVSVSAATVYSAAEITEKMGVGWNLGNSLDSNNNGFSSENIYDYETQWSNPVVTQSLIDKVRTKGFNTIRIPVTWYQHISSDGNYTIDAAWMNRVKEVVDYAYNNGMYVIINVHHENWINRSDFETTKASMETELRAVWKQIAAAFADYDQRLIFEGMNEPRKINCDEEWNGNEACYNVVNQLNSAFVETVRSVESPYRQTRMLMVPDYAASRENNIYSHLTIPKASGSIDADNDGDDDYVAVSLHAYSPYSFAMGDGDHTNFSSSYEAELEGMFSAMQATFLQEGVQIVLGEFSASNYGYDSARIKWAEAYMRNATEYGIPCVLWDNNVESNNGGEAHGYINRSTEDWYSSGGQVVNTLISTRNSTQWGTKSYINYPMYAHNAFSSGLRVSIATDGNISVSGLSNFQSGKEFAIKYNGITLPEFALMTSTWGGWTTLSPYDFDKDNGIAYFSYDQIMKTWNTANGTLGWIKLNNINSIGFGGITLIDIPEDGTFKINSQPSDKSVTEGGTATFSISASGNSILYQWQTSSDGSVWTDIQGANSSALSVTADMNMNGHKFRCVVTSGSETLTSNAAVLTVRAKTTSGSHNEYYSGTDVTVESDGAIKLYNISGFESGKELAIKFNGSTVPEIALMNMDWNGWIIIEPYDIDTDNNIAYVSYDQMTEAWADAWGTDKGTLAHAKIANKDSISYEGVKLLDIPEQQPATEFEITENPSDKSAYYCQQITLTAAASAKNSAYSWKLSRDNGSTWTDAICTSENVSSDSGSTRAEAVFDFYKNSISERDTVLFRCDFTNGNTTKSTSSAKVTVLSRNAAANVGTVKFDSAEISWEANSFAVSYNVYRVQNEEFVLMGSFTGTSCTLTELSAGTDYEVFVSAVYSDGAAMPYNYNSIKFTTAQKTVDDMTIEECIALVNSISTDDDTVILTEEQLRAVERVLAFDYGE